MKKMFKIGKTIFIIVEKIFIIVKKNVYNCEQNFIIQETLVPKLTLGPFLTLSVRNGHKLKDCSFRIPAHIESKSR